MRGPLAIRCPVFAGFWLLAALAGSDCASAQGFPAPQQMLPLAKAPPPVPAGFREQTSQNAAAPCLEPERLPDLKDYNGPMQKTVGLFARALERKSVHQPHYKPGFALCSLRLEDKFLLFVEDSIDPVTFLSAGFDAGIDQATDRDPTFGQGAAGYGRRFGADLADRVSSKFFKDFAYPALFFEDPRYYRLGQGGTGRRLLHAVQHVVIAHRSDGTHMPNFSEWFGTGTSVALSNLYHPGNDRGAGAMAQQMGYRFAGDIGFDILREFWPEIARKFKLPFRENPVSPPPPPGSQISKPHQHQEAPTCVQQDCVPQD